MSDLSNGRFTFKDRLKHVAPAVAVGTVLGFAVAVKLHPNMKSLGDVWISGPALAYIVEHGAITVKNANTDLLIDLVKNTSQIAA